MCVLWIVISNCKVYNSPNTNIISQAEKIEEKFGILYQKFEYKLVFYLHWICGENVHVGFDAFGFIFCDFPDSHF